MSYLCLLRELVNKRYCDREIAEALRDPALLNWNTLKQCEQAIGVIPFGDRWWTQRMVRYHRQKHGIQSPNIPRTEMADLFEARIWHRRVYARRWLHLLDRGIDLRPREVDILDALFDHGPQTRPQLCQRLGVTDLYKSVNYLGNLLQAELIVKQGEWRGRRRHVTYDLAENATRFFGSGYGSGGSN